MIWDSGALQTRQFARRQLALPARVEVHPDQADQLRLSFDDEHGRPTVVDVSEGGLGLQSAVFLPRNARLLVHVQPPEAAGAGIPDTLAVRLVVRRCLMVDVKPTYHIGLQYLEPGVPEIQELVRIGEAARSADNGKPDDPQSKARPDDH